MTLFEYFRDWKKEWQYTWSFWIPVIGLIPLKFAMHHGKYYYPKYVPDVYVVYQFCCILYSSYKLF